MPGPPLESSLRYFSVRSPTLPSSQTIEFPGRKRGLLSCLGSMGRSCALAAISLFFIGSGCEQRTEVRVYDAPKADTVFVSGSPSLQNQARSAPTPPISGPRRILGAVIPMESGCYFLKATDSPENLQPLLSDFYTIVLEFAINASTGKPEMKLPEGWTMNPRNDIAMAELISPSATRNIKFTVTVLGMPAADQWQGYLLSNINRWRGQLKLPDLAIETLDNELISVKRPSSLLPGYIFDAVGNGSGSMTSPAASAPPASPSPTSPNPPADEPTKPKLSYQLPDGWRTAPGTPFRLATFAIASADNEAEVTVSLAADNPIDNTMMWYQQVSKENDPEKIKAMAESTIASAEKFTGTLGDGILYAIQNSEQVDAPKLLVASLPSKREDLRVFAKLRGPSPLVDAQRDNFVQFIQSLQLE
jgi:hypothetical protein